MSLHIDFRLLGAGLAECEVKSAKASCTLRASYLYRDPLRTLIVAGTGVLAGFKKLSFSFDEEPGEFLWSISHFGYGKIAVVIDWFEDGWTDDPDEKGKRVLSITCDPLIFATAVEKAATAVLKEHGLAGYKEHWGDSDFPSKQMDALGDAIALWRRYG